MKTIILGGGLAGVSLSCYLDQDSVILEREPSVGGLCRSFDLNSIYYDIGPHILFSRNEPLLNEMLGVVGTKRIRRSNKILYKGRMIKYPFENDLAALEGRDTDRCLEAFLNNPHSGIKPRTMLDFFLKTFGEGITDLYLKPYNEKMWKCPADSMDTQIVERIPRPPDEDILKSARGIQTEGYLHQLYFHYPISGGIQSLVEGYGNRLGKKTSVVTSVNIISISRSGDGWVVDTDKGRFPGDTLVSCIPCHELFSYLDAPGDVAASLAKLKFNSIHIVAAQYKKDSVGENFALYVPDEEIIFHRLSKLNFLGSDYCLKNGGSTLLAEVTYRQGVYPADLSPQQVKEKVINDLEALNLAYKCDILDIDIRSFKYAYVVYDLEHRKNVDAVLGYLSGRGIKSCGRFAQFEYLNMDQVVAGAKGLASKLKG